MDAIIDFPWKPTLPVRIMKDVPLSHCSSLLGSGVLMHPNSSMRVLLASVICPILTLSGCGNSDSSGHTSSVLRALNDHNDATAQPGSTPPEAGLATDHTGSDGTALPVLTATVNVEQGVANVAPSFLGFSQEWWLGPLADRQMIGIFKRFASYDSGPLILRIGGSTADDYATVPSQTVWSTLTKLHRELGMRFILDLNLGANDKELTKAQQTAALENLPSSSIMSFEIGNEPNYWPRTGRRPENYFTYVATEFKEFAEAISCSTYHCSGPAWGHIFMEPWRLEAFLATNKGLLQLSTVHFYKANNQTFNDAVTLLEESALQKAMSSLKSQVVVSNNAGLPLRVDESNAISGGGLDGVSNVFSAALWILDTTFEIAYNGAVGVDYHQGSPLYAFFEQRQVPETTQRAIYAQPAFFGTMFWLEAVKGSGTQETTILSKQISGSGPVKVWPLKQGAELRFVMINKGPDQAHTVQLELNSNAYGDGTLTRLVGPSLTAKSGITIAGINYDTPGAEPSGQYQFESVPVVSESSGSSYTVEMPPASAALLVVKR